MKTPLTLSALFIALSLSACGDKHQTYAVDALEQAQANAIANAPKAESIKFDDENSAKVGATTTNTTDTATPANTATATTEATEPATTEQSTDTATATAETKTNQ